MENRNQTQRPRHTVAAHAIASNLKKLASEANIEIFQCQWNVGQDVEHVGRHRLDIFSPACLLRMYFDDHEITAYAPDSENHTNLRIRKVIDDLREQRA